RAARPRRVGRRPRDHGEGPGAPAPVTAPWRPALRAGGAAGAALRRRAVAGGLRARLSRALPMISALAVRLPNWLGDTVMSEPAVRALRRAHPQAQVLLAGPWATVLGGQGLADTLVTYPRAWSGRLAAADVVRRLAPDTAVLLPNPVESALAAWYWGAGRRIGFDAGLGAKGLTELVRPPSPPRRRRRRWPGAIVPRCCRRSSRSWTRSCLATRAWRISPPRSARPWSRCSVPPIPRCRRRAAARWR